MSEQIIIAMSGRKCAGKNTIGDFICKWYANLEAPVFPAQALADRTLQCSFADNLKDFLIDTLGLRREQCYGTDNEKNSPTEYLWENASPFLAWKFGSREIHRYGRESTEVKHYSDSHLGSEELRRIYYSSNGGTGPAGYRRGPMSGRDIMQIFGTDLIRETFGNVWAKATIRRIKKAGKPFSVITDNRFPNEIDAVLDEPRGYIIRLTRSPFGNKDIHPSEAALDKFDWNQERCFVLDNSQMTLEQQNEAVLPILHQILGVKR